MWERMLQSRWSCFASCKRCRNLKCLSSCNVFEDKITGEESTIRGHCNSWCLLLVSMNLFSWGSCCRGADVRSLSATDWRTAKVAFPILVEISKKLPKSSLRSCRRASLSPKVGWAFGTVSEAPWESCSTFTPCGAPCIQQSCTVWSCLWCDHYFLKAGGGDNFHDARVSSWAGGSGWVQALVTSWLQKSIENPAAELLRSFFQRLESGSHLKDSLRWGLICILLALLHGNKSAAGSSLPPCISHHPPL